MNSGINDPGLKSTWFERLVLNLLSYSVILFPIALIVIATKCRILPKSIMSSSLIQYFVYGTPGGVTQRSRKNQADAVSLQGDNKKLLVKEVKSLETQPSVSKTLDFLWCLVGLQVSYLIWGFLQEKIMTTKYPASSMQRKSIDFTDHINSTKISLLDNYITFHDSQFLVFINRLVAFITAILALVYTKHQEAREHASLFSSSNLQQIVANHHRDHQKPSAPLFEDIYCSLSNIMSSWCQYEALKYVNFPTQCLSKSCKVIPVMIMSKILLRKRYPILDYLCALLLALGLFVFMLNQPIQNHKEKHIGQDNHTAPNSDKSLSKSTFISGLMILALYLTFDSFTSNWQQNLYSHYNISNWQMMAAINFYSILLTLTSLYQLGNLRPAFLLLASSSLLLRDCMLMSIMSSIGQMFVYYTIKRFGSVIFAVIMTLRQFFSILLSCALYGHSLNFESSIGLMMVFLVVAFQVWHKSKKNNNNSRHSASDSIRTQQLNGTTGPDVYIEFKPLAK